MTCKWDFEGMTIREIVNVRWSFIEIDVVDIMSK